MFGESDWDRRDWTMSLAGLVAGLHALRILAERGIASGEDIRASLVGVRSLLAKLPNGSVDTDTMLRMDNLLADLEAASFANKGFDAPDESTPHATPPVPTPPPPPPDPRYDGAMVRRDALDDHGNLMSIEEYERKRDGIPPRDGEGDPPQP